MKSKMASHYYKLDIS